MKLLTSYPKDQFSNAVKFARSYSKTFPYARVILENYLDANGCSVWMGLNKSHDNREIILFIDGKRKKAA
jgi:hypothetical protein